MNGSTLVSEIYLHNTVSFLGEHCFFNYGILDGMSIYQRKGLINNENYETYLGSRIEPNILSADDHEEVIYA
jgi:hypothetical protein